MTVAVLHGNRCGHDPLAPRYVMRHDPYAEGASTDTDDLGHKRKYSWFYDATQALNEYYRYYKTLPLLGTIYSHEKSRKRRSEAREADIATLSALIHHVELASVNWKQDFCRVGTPSKEGFLYFDNKYWMKKAGLSESRLKRSFARLQAAGYVRRERRWVEREKGKFKGLAAMTVINLSLFRDLNVMDGLKQAAEFAYKRLQQEASRMSTAIGSMLACAVERIKKPTSTPTKAKSEDYRDYSPNTEKHWLLRCTNETERQAFRHRYLNMLAEAGGGECEPSEVMRRAFNSLRD